MILQGQDGELRLIEFGNAGTTYFLEVLFCEMDFSGPTSRPRAEETLVLDRNKADSNMHYTLGPDTPRYEPIPITFSARIDDAQQSRVLSDWLSGVTIINGQTLYTWKGQTTIDGNTLPTFISSAVSRLDNNASRIEIMWDGASDIGYQYNEVTFTPGEQTITESPDGLIMNANGMVHGDVTRITGFGVGGTHTSII